MQSGYVVFNKFLIPSTNQPISYLQFVVFIQQIFYFFGLPPTSFLTFGRLYVSLPSFNKSSASQMRISYLELRRFYTSANKLSRTWASLYICHQVTYNMGVFKHQPISFLQLRHLPISPFSEHRVATPPTNIKSWDLHFTKLQLLGGHMVIPPW